MPCSSGGGGILGDRAQLELWHSRKGIGPDVLIAVAPGERNYRGVSYVAASKKILFSDLLLCFPPLYPQFR